MEGVMRKLEPVHLKSWLLPLIVLALVAPAVAGFAIAGPPLGLALGAIEVTVLLVLAARARFDEPIEVGSTRGDRYAILVVATEPIEDPATGKALAEIAASGVAATGSEGDAELLVLAPAVNTAVAHWLSDVRRARFDAQRRLALSIGTLAAAGLDARGAVGDSDVVQALEDALRTFPAQEVVFVTGDADPGIDEVRRRLDRPVRHLAAGPEVAPRARSR
jgi:hypothetical protein